MTLSEKVKHYRIAYPMTQKQLAEKAGVSLRTIINFENGEDIKLSVFVKILNALGLGSNMDVLVPDVTERPSYHVNQMHLKKRVRIKKEEKTAFRWGDEE